MTNFKSGQHLLACFAVFLTDSLHIHHFIIDAYPGKPHTVSEELILPADFKYCFACPPNDIIKTIPLSKSSLQRYIGEIA